MSEKINEELDYSIKVSNHSTVQMRSVAPQGNSSVTGSATSSVGPVEFIIPPSVWNPKKSRLNFNLRVPEVSAKYTWVNANLLNVISRVTLYDSATNSLILDVNSFDKYSSMVLPAATHIDEFLSKSYAGQVPAATLAPSQLRTVEDITKAGSGTNYTGITTGTLDAFSKFTGRLQYYVQTVAGDGAAAGDVFLDVSIPFESFKNTFLSVNRQVYFPSNLVLQIYFNAGSQYTFTANSATDTTTNQDCAVSPVFSNISLSLANEGNLAIISSVIEKTMKEGISMPIAYPTVTRQSLASASAHSYSLSLTRGYGQRILGIISAPFTAAGKSTTAQRHIRGNLTTFNTFLNNVPVRSAAGYSAILSQDYYNLMKNFIDRSTIQTLGEFVNAEYLLVDSWVGDKPLWKWDEEQTEIDGLDVGAQSSMWQIQANLSAATAYDWISAIIGQKTLTINNMGSTVS